MTAADETQKSVQRGKRECGTPPRHSDPRKENRWHDQFWGSMIVFLWVSVVCGRQDRHATPVPLTPPDSLR